MKKTISAKALTVLRAIADGRTPESTSPVLTIGSAYKMFVREPAAFRSAAAHDAGYRVALEVFPGFPNGAALGIDLDGRAWLGFQSECDDWAAPFARRSFRAHPGMADMAAHLVRLIELHLLSLSTAQIAAFNVDMRKTVTRAGGAVDRTDEDVAFSSGAGSTIS